MIVQVEEGQLRGVEKNSSLTGRPFYAFLGIPYAEPPVDDLRFRAPVPKRKWNGILDASEEGNECFQMDPQQKIMGSEDCLYLNVYTPEPPSDIKIKKAVMVYIHGGGFYCDSGTAKIYGPDFLIGHEVIYVTLNYRLHVFGFLNAGTASCPGNAGLKDQSLALKWVKKNIGAFGGDPYNITIFGESAGAASVHLHMLSPLSRGLYQRAIMQSGNALSPWAFQKDSESCARQIGQLAGYRGQDLEGIIEYLKYQPARQLTELANRCLLNAKMESPGSVFTLPFIPSAEKIKDGAFLPDSPEILLRSATPIPTIVGITNQEGLLQLFRVKREQFESSLSDLSVVVKNNFRLDESQRAELEEAIKAFYFNNEAATIERLAPFVNLYTDFFFMKFYDAIDYLIRSDTPPYVYSFSHNGKSNFIKNMASQIYPEIKNIQGACHADDLGYLFSQSRFPCEMDDADKKVLNHICTLWTNFAKTGDPTSSLREIDWKPHTTDRPCYISIEETLNVFNDALLGERLNFWKKWSANTF